MVTITKPARSVDWTKDRIAALATPDVKQLRANAVRLNDPEITQRCDAVLEERPRGRGAAKKAVPGAAPKKPRAKRKAPVAKAPEATSPETGGAA